MIKLSPTICESGVCPTCSQRIEMECPTCVPEFKDLTDRTGKRVYLQLLGYDLCLWWDKTIMSFRGHLNFDHDEHWHFVVNEPYSLEAAYYYLVGEIKDREWQKYGDYKHVSKHIRMFDHIIDRRQLEDVFNMIGLPFVGVNCYNSVPGLYTRVSISKDLNTSQQKEVTNGLIGMDGDLLVFEGDISKPKIDDLKFYKRHEFEKQFSKR